MACSHKYLPWRRYAVLDNDQEVVESDIEIEEANENESLEEIKNEKLKALEMFYNNVRTIPKNLFKEDPDYQPELAIKLEGIIDLLSMVQNDKQLIENEVFNMHDSVKKLNLADHESTVKKETQHDEMEATTSKSFNNSITEDQYLRMFSNKLMARKKVLNSFDYANFFNVPQFIVDAFFDGSNYSNRRIVCSFCFLNGIQLHEMFELVHWPVLSKSDEVKMKDLYSYFEKDYVKQKYYSYSAAEKAVMYLDGSLKMSGKRFENN